jgi:hypothetical protein
MNDVTKFSGMWTRMAFDYSRSTSRRRAARPATGTAPVPDASTSDELAVRAAMERAIERYQQRKAVA